MDRVRLGFIGAGGIAERHLGVLGRFEDVVIVALADPDVERARAVAARCGAHAYAGHAQMLDTVALDAVFICVPPFAHGAPERAAIAHNLPFFVEKPVSLTLPVAEEIAREIEKRGLITGVGYHWRYMDTVEEARVLLADRPPHLLSGYWLASTPPPRWWWRRDGSGGQMVEQTTHVLDLARHLAGDITQVFGLAAHAHRTDFPDFDVPAASTASLAFASGAIGNVGSTCLLRWGHRIGLHVFCDSLAIELSEHDLMVDVGAGRPVRRAEGDPVWRQDRDFIDAVRGERNLIRCPYHEALETHRVALAIEQSVATRQPVALRREVVHA
jgi:predicted dehydrogenase